MKTDTPILVWGAGAMGATLAAHFVRAGREVLLVDNNVSHVAALNENGLTLTGPILEGRFRVAACTPDQLTGRYPLILLATKALHTRTACRMLAEHLTDDGVVVSVQNGLNEVVIALEVGAPRTFGCFVNFGADLMAPGEVMFGGWGATVVGEIDGRLTDRARDIHALFTLFNPDAVLTANIHGFLWGKLVYGSLLFATALTDEGIAGVLENDRYRPLLVALAREVCQVAHAHGVTLEGFDGFAPDAFAPDAPLGGAYASLDRLAAHNRRSAKKHAGIWRDLSVHKRKTEVDEIIAPIARIGREHGVPTPLTDALVRAVHAAEGGVPLGLELLESVRAAMPEGAVR